MPTTSSQASSEFAHPTGRDAVARPLGVRLAGLPAKAVTRGYHLYALPAAGNRIRVAVDWLLDAALHRQVAQLGYIPEADVTLPAAEHTDLYAAFTGTAASTTRPVDHASSAPDPR